MHANLEETINPLDSGAAVNDVFQALNDVESDWKCR